MRINEFVEDHLKPYKEKVAYLESRQRELSELYGLVNDPAFKKHIETWFVKLRQEGVDELATESEGGILSIWFHLKSIWQAKRQMQIADRFLSWTGSIFQELTEVSEQLHDLTKP